MNAKSTAISFSVAANYFTTFQKIYNVRKNRIDSNWRQNGCQNMSKWVQTKKTRTRRWTFNFSSLFFFILIVNGFQNQYTFRWEGNTRINNMSGSICLLVENAVFSKIENFHSRIYIVSTYICIHLCDKQHH